MNRPARYATAVCRANDLITELAIENPSEITIEKIAAFKNAPVRFADISGCDGRLVRMGQHGIITVRQSITRKSQIRFVIAHELGHFLLHPTIKQIDEVHSQQLRNWGSSQQIEELEANYFAAEVLMPQRFFENDIGRKVPSWDFVRGLADRYTTTLSSTAIQFVRFTHEPVTLVASEHGLRKWFVASSNQEFFLRDEADIHPYTCAREVLDSGKNHSFAHNVPAGAWFRDFDPDSKDYVTEDSIKAADSSFVLTIIWVKHAI
jgi:hypothetical protein